MPLEAAQGPKLRLPADRSTGCVRGGWRCGSFPPRARACGADFAPCASLTAPPRAWLCRPSPQLAAPSTGGLQAHLRKVRRPPRLGLASARRGGALCLWGRASPVCDFPLRSDALSSPYPCIRPQMAPKSPGTTTLNDVKTLNTWQLAESNKTATSAEGLATAHQSRHVAYAHPGTAVHQSSPWANARYYAHCAERVELHRILTILCCRVRLHPALCPPPPLPSPASRRASTAQRGPRLRLWHDQRHPDGERNAQLQCRPPPVC